MVDLATRIVNVQPRIVTICSCPQMWNHGLRPFGEDCSNRVICISHSAFVPIFMLIYVLAFPNHRADYIRTTWKYSGRFRSIFKARRPRKKQTVNSCAKGKEKGKASSLHISPLTILNSGALQPRKWQLTGIDCSTAAQTVAA